LRCFQRNFETRHRPGQQEFREAHFWIFQDKGSDPFSFEDLCDVLGVDLVARTTALQSSPTRVAQWGRSTSTLV
jgi:hypothetical protein